MIDFLKMHGLGNDFVVIDARTRPVALDEARVRRIADRREGVGCDQLIVLEAPRNGHAQAFMRIWNSSGEEVEACGNATRCVARLLAEEAGAGTAAIETLAGRLEASLSGEERVAVDMGEVRLGWREIPLAREVDTLQIPLALGDLADPVGVNVGNPHAVFFVGDVEAIAIETLGPALEHDPLFPRRANIGVAALLGPDRLRLRVWERGAGLTKACGTGACAAAVAAHRRGLTGRKVVTELDGGPLEIEWREADGHVVMTGPAALSFRGSLAEEFLA